MLQNYMKAMKVWIFREWEEEFHATCSHGCCFHDATICHWFISGSEVCDLIRKTSISEVFSVKACFFMGLFYKRKWKLLLVGSIKYVFIVCQLRNKFCSARVLVLNSMWNTGVSYKISRKRDLFTFLSLYSYLFFSDWDSLSGDPKVERAFMDGTNRQDLIKTKLGWPAGITLDIVSKRLYWVDSRFDYIETVTYDGLQR